MSKQYPDLQSLRVQINEIYDELANGRDPSKWEIKEHLDKTPLAQDQQLIEHWLESGKLRDIEQMTRGRKSRHIDSQLSLFSGLQAYYVCAKTGHHRDPRSLTVTEFSASIDTTKKKNIEACVAQYDSERLAVQQMFEFCTEHQLSPSKTTLGDIEAAILEEQST